MSGEDLVHVRWRDHVSFRQADHRKVYADRVESVGWLVEEDEEKIVIVHTRSLIEAEDRDKRFSHGMVILRSCIDEIRALEYWDYR